MEESDLKFMLVKRECKAFLYDNHIPEVISVIILVSYPLTASFFGFNSSANGNIEMIQG